MRKFTRALALALGILLLAGSLAACGPEGESSPTAQTGETKPPSQAVAQGLVRIAVSDPISTMDVHLNTEDYMIPLNIYERLFDLRVEADGSASLTKGLAESWSTTDNRCFRFNLREDAYFSDGSPVLASDVAFSFTRMLALPGSQQTDFADMILGAEAVLEGRTDSLAGIEVLGEKSLEITLSEPNSSYLFQLAAPACSILSEKCVTEAGADYGRTVEHTLGSGPYRLTEYTDSRITLERNPCYHCHEDEELTVQRAEFQVLAPALIDRKFRDGELDLLDMNRVNPEIVESVYKTPAWSERTISCSRVEVQYLMLNLETPPLNDLRIRRAVQMAINRQRIVDELFNGDGCLLDGIYPRGLNGYSPANQGWLQYDPEGARALVEQVPEAAELRVELAANSQSENRTLRMLDMIRQDLIAAGINASVVSYDEESRLYLRRQGSLMAYTGTWSADFNDPDNFIYTLFGSLAKTHSRSSNYANVSVLARIAAARSIQNNTERMAEYAALERRLVQQDAVWVPLFSSDHLFVLGDRLERFTPFWAGWGDLYLRDLVLKPEAR